MVVKTVADTTGTNGEGESGHDISVSVLKRAGYVMPVLHTRVAEPVIGMAFAGALVATVAFGAVDLPVAALIGASVVVARHHSRQN
ncbi:MAG: hypothetical protein M1399_09555 [Actinobacteria bacterium]|nr:hypothetical protein [Actinomycetota bacterium]MCL5447362.1 hypothetical protein [Actinomycetota bacterium]